MRKCLLTAVALLVYCVPLRYCDLLRADAEPVSVKPNQTEPQEPRWQLFLDDHVITRSTGFRRVLHHPQPRGVVLKPDKPWEVMGSSGPGYVGRRKDGSLECYYQALWWDVRPGDQIPPDDHPRYTHGTAYAVSEDGIHWEKPILNLVDGPAEPIDRDSWPPYAVPTGRSKANNLAPCSPRDLGKFGNVRDPAKRFSVCMSTRPKPRSPIYFGSSPPDLMNDPQWREKFVDSGGWRAGPDVQYWDDIHQEWVGMGQAPNHPPTRCGGRFASEDLKNWTLEHFIYPDAADSTDPRHFDEIYGVGTIYLEGMVLAFLSWFTGDQTYERFTGDRGLIGKSVGKGPMEVRIATSRDGGKTWDRTVTREAWIPHGTEEDSYDRCVRPPTLLRVGDEDWLYCSVINGDHSSIRRYYRDHVPFQQGALYVQKHNRYVSLTAGNRPQILITKPIKVTGKTLQLNVDGSRGEVKVAIGIDKWLRHKTGQWPFEAKLPHWMVEDRWERTHLEKDFHFDDCEPVHVNSIEHNVEWKGAKLKLLLGKTVRLYILVQDADLYGFRFK